jgi:hypothetical protein
MADREWTADCVADHFEEAFRTLRKLPPVKAQGYFNTWPDIVRTSREIAAMEPQPMRVWPSAAAITRLEQTFDWVLWIEEEERKLIWSRAARVPWKQISGELGVDRTTAWRKHKLALTKIASRLNVKATPICCNTFVFDTCNISVLPVGHDGESALEDGSPRFLRWIPLRKPGSSWGPRR